MKRIYETGIKAASYKHGHTSQNGKRKLSRTYISWFQMKHRCDNSHSKQFKDYGGRGISYDPRWAMFSNFLSDMGNAPEDRFLDRKNNNLGYSKKNCRWATRTQNNRNQRSNVIVEFQGERLIISEWAERLGLKYSTLYMRLVVRKWPVEKALQW